MSSHLQNTFLNSFSAYISIFQAFILDPLHAIEQGEHGKHLWPWLCEALPESSLSEIDSWYIWLYFHGDTIGPNYMQVSNSVPNFRMLIILEMVLPGSITLPALNMVKYYR